MNDDARLLIGWACSKGWTFRDYATSSTALRAIERRSPLEEKQAAKALWHSSTALGLKPDMGVLMTASKK